MLFTIEIFILEGRWKFGIHFHFERLAGPEGQLGRRCVPENSPRYCPSKEMAKLDSIRFRPTEEIEYLVKPVDSCSSLLFAPQLNALGQKVKQKFASEESKKNYSQLSFFVHLLYSISPEPFDVERKVIRSGDAHVTGR